MHYRIFDKQNDTYISSCYNETLQKVFRTTVEDELAEYLTEIDLIKLKKAKWEDYKKILEEKDFLVEESAEPFTENDMIDYTSDLYSDLYLDEHGWEEDDEWGDYMSDDTYDF